VTVQWLENRHLTAGGRKVPRHTAVAADGTVLVVDADDRPAIRSKRKVLRRQGDDVIIGQPAG